MITKHARYASPHAWAPLALFVSAGGCSLWAGATLSDKPEELTGAGGTAGGVGGAGGGAVNDDGAAAVSSGAVTSSGSGGPGPSCDQDQVDCDGDPKNGCEADLKSDPNNCGECHTLCIPPGRCTGGSCQ